MVCFHWTEISQACSGLRPLLLYLNPFDEWRYTLTTLLKICYSYELPQKYEGGRNSKVVGVSSFVCCVCLCARVCVRLHCPQIGSDDSTMLTSQDALAFKTYSITSGQLSASCVNRPVSLRGVDEEDSALWQGGIRQTDRLTD